MNSWIAVSPTDHAKSYWQQRVGYHFAAKMNATPVLVAELSKVAPLYPLAFVKGEFGYHFVAILGLGPERNFYVNNQGQWLCDYIPASIRGYPFILANNDSGDRRIFCIDADMLSTNPGNPPLFDDSGNLTGIAADTFSFLQQCDSSRQITEAACQNLDNAGLIEPWPLELSAAESGVVSTVQGLYRINETALNALDAETFAALRIHGALLIAYSQLLSINQLDQLTKLAQYLSKETELRDITGVSSDDSVLNFDSL
ncbi:MAG: SapC family protein [Pseudohongiella sp.]|nr:SapC family protein [Pseudohongiella sp.]